MKITLFTSNKPRHNYLINFLSKKCDKLNVIQECSTIFPGYLSGIYPKGEKLKNILLKFTKRKTKFLVIK